VLYLATSRVWDGEMAARVAAHRETRPVGWRTVEEPERLVEALEAAGSGGVAVTLVESIDMWVSNRLIALHPVEGEDQTRLESALVRQLEDDLLGDVRRVVEAHRSEGTRGGHVVAVTVEAGWGVVPAYPLGRAFRDVLGRVNAAFAAEADEVYLMVAGLAVEVKHLASGVTNAPIARITQHARDGR